MEMTKVLHECEESRQFELLTTIPGIGRVLGMMIALESGPMNRFAISFGNYLSVSLQGGAAADFTHIIHHAISCFACRVSHNEVGRLFSSEKGMSH